MSYIWVWFAVSLFRNANKNWVKIQEHFFFGCFHPIRDYSVEVPYFWFKQIKLAKTHLYCLIFTPAPDHILHFSKSVRFGWWWVDSTLEAWEPGDFLWESITSFEKSCSWPEGSPAWRLDPTRQRLKRSNKDDSQNHGESILLFYLIGSVPQANRAKKTAGLRCRRRSLPGNQGYRSRRQNFSWDHNRGLFDWENNTAP